jgi:hypothetical protein
VIGRRIGQAAVRRFLARAGGVPVPQRLRRDPCAGRRESHWQDFSVADQDDVRRIALALPHTTESTEHFAFSVRNKGKEKGFVWAWNERVEPKKPRVPRADVVAIRVVDNQDKEALLASDEQTFFTEPHYNGFPAVLVRLPVVELDQLEELIVDGWRCQAPKALVEAFDLGSEVG